MPGGISRAMRMIPALVDVAFEGPVDVSEPDPSVFEACDYVIQELGEERYVAGTTGGI